MVTLKTKQVRDTVNLTVSWRDIAKKLKPLYEDQGYAPPSEIQLQNAIIKAASILKPKKEKRSNRYYYESSFLDDAVEYIFKNQNFKLHKSEKYELRNIVKKLTNEYLNAFDLLVTSSSTLKLHQNEDIEFEKSGWFNLQALFNFLWADDVDTFEGFQRKITLQRSLCTTLDHYSDSLFIREFFSTFAYDMLKDFDHIIIVNENKNEMKELSYFYNILDFNKIAQRIASHLGLFIRKYENHFSNGDSFANVYEGELLFSLYEETIVDFVSHHKESSIQDGKNKQKIAFFKGDRYFWKQNL